MPDLDFENLIKSFTPIALAIAWIWAQLRLSDKEEHTQKLEIEERERAYSERLEKRLEKAQKELETALVALKDQENAEELLKAVVSADPGIMFVKKRLGPKNYIVLRVSKGYAVAYLGGPSSVIEGQSEKMMNCDFSINDEQVYTSQSGMMVREPIYSPFTGIKGVFVGRKFPLNFSGLSYIIGVGEHEFDKEA